jgi:hypothetical protein
MRGLVPTILISTRHVDMIRNIAGESIWVVAYSLLALENIGSL